ncbi:hypothetical protein KQX54_011523 [Cotesia glomerata]|uniref:Secreted protein n=1 Tax=Cotesia glomerata TaxID=32391 RepID=A0AAV7I6V6_COTGL|nr:hypothetical protein KQX54_011523 [Cotesia glomerata]
MGQHRLIFFGAVGSRIFGVLCCGPFRDLCECDTFVCLETPCQQQGARITAHQAGSEQSMKMCLYTAQSE